MTPQQVITEARYILNDTDAAAYRQSDTELLGDVNGALREMALLSPTTFSTVAPLVCTPSQCEQAITFTDALMLIEVLCITGSTALTPFDRDRMTSFNPNWRADTPATARQWSKFSNDPLRFFVYPAAPATPQTLDVRYVRNPTTYAIGTTITDVPVSMQPALVDYVVYRAQSKDSEHVLSGRAQAFYQSFLTKIKG